jgi:hypothetical protein
LQRKLTPTSLSENEKLGEVTADGFDGFVPIDGTGGAVRSIVHVYEVGSLYLLLSFTRTLNVWLPAAKPL